jgi:hypothetical protein
MDAPRRLVLVKGESELPDPAVAVRKPPLIREVSTT